MITTLADFYKTISPQLPGVSSHVLESEFQKAERRACFEARIWESSHVVTVLEGQSVYEIQLPHHADLVACKEICDTKGQLINPSQYIISVGEPSVTADIHVDIVSGSNVPDVAQGNFIASDTYTFNDDAVYFSEDDQMAFYRAVKGASATADLYIITTMLEFENHYIDNTIFPKNYFATPADSGDHLGVMDGYGEYSGKIESCECRQSMAVFVELAPAYVNRFQTDEEFTVLLNLMPEVDESAAPKALLATYGELISTMALHRLLLYPKSFPWSDHQKADSVVRHDLKRLLTLAKYEAYRRYKRTTLRMRPQRFL